MYKGHVKYNGAILLYMFVVVVDTIIYSCSLKEYLEKNDSTSESVVWEFLVDLCLVCALTFFIIMLIG